MPCRMQHRKFVLNVSIAHAIRYFDIALAMKFRRLCSVVMGAATLSSVAAQTRISSEALDTAVRIRNRAMTDSTAFEFAAGLTSEIGPRLAGSENDQRARSWVIKRFKALGFDRVWEEPVTYPRWVRHRESATIVSPFLRRLVISALGGSPGTGADGVSGKVVSFPSFEALQAAKATTTKGKIVYIAYQMRAERDGGDYDEAAAGRTHGPALAARLGAIGFVMRSAGTNRNRLPHTGFTAFDPPDVKIPAAALSRPDADALERWLAKGKELTLRLDLDCGFDGNYTGANIIGQITGSEHPEETVDIGAHLDSWDVGTGAIDDGAGLAIVAGAAHLIAELPVRPKRSINVIAFANEESGHLGGRAFAEAHGSEVERHIIGAESDLGSGRIWRLSSRVSSNAQGAIDQILQVLAPLGVERGSDGDVDSGDFERMRAAGMAVADFGQDATNYFDWHHTASDTLDKINVQDLNQSVATYAVFAYLAAQADGSFGSGRGALVRNLLK